MQPPSIHRKVTGLEEARTPAADPFNAPDRREFHFRLDERPERIWADFFNDIQREAAGDAAFLARIDGSHIVVEGTYDTLPQQLETLKARVAMTNERFARWDGEQAAARKKRRDAQLDEELRLAEVAKKLKFD
jgi:hypothetical protein